MEAIRPIATVNAVHARIRLETYSRYTSELFGPDGSSVWLSIPEMTQYRHDAFHLGQEEALIRLWESNKHRADKLVARATMPRPIRQLLWPEAA